MEEESRTADSKKRLPDIVEKEPLVEGIVERDAVDGEPQDTEMNLHQVLDASEVGVEATTKGPVREEEHIFNIAFTQPQLGIVLNSDIDSNCAYITDVDEEVNPMLKNVDMEMNSKVLRVNEVDVEMLTFSKILACIVAGKENIPLTITFCRPGGLGEGEVPDLNPKT